MTPGKRGTVRGGAARKASGRHALGMVHNSFLFRADHVLLLTTQ
jgi:hypothetical protein